MKKEGFAVAGLCALGIIASQTLGKDAAPVSVPEAEAVPVAVPGDFRGWHGSGQALDYEPKLDGSKFTIHVPAELQGNYSVSMRFADDRGRILKLSGGECQPLEFGGNLSAVLEDTESFEYATIYTQIYRGDTCEDEKKEGKLLTENATHFKNRGGHIEIIGEEEFYMDSSINMVYSVEE